MYKIGANLSEITIEVFGISLSSKLSKQSIMKLAIFLLLIGVAFTAAEINNYNDDFVNHLDEMSVMLDELNEILEEGNVEGIKDWWKKIKHKVKRFSKAVRRGLTSASKKVYKVVIKGAKYAIRACRKHEDICRKLAKAGLRVAGRTLLMLLG